MRLLRRVLVVGLFGVAMLVHFTNCGQVPQQADLPTVEGCESASCLPPIGSSIAISGPSNVTLKSTETHLPDIGGNCGAAEFEVNAIAYRVIGVDGFTVLNGRCQFDGACGRCVAGKWSFAGANQIVLGWPTGVTAQTGMKIEIELRGIDGGYSIPGIENAGILSIWVNVN